MANKPDWLTERSAAIPIFNDNGVIKIVLVTTKSKHKANWIFPKGQIELGMTPYDSAAKEAYEEAGVIGKVSPVLFDEYQHDKWGGKMCVKVYTLEVDSILEQWKEMRDRKRQILTLDDAINTVQSEQKNALLKLKQQFTSQDQTQATSITPAQLNREIKADKNIVLLDVRESSEQLINGVLSNDDVHIPLNLVEGKADSKIKNRHAKIVVYCGKGIRGVTAANTLNLMGYTNVTNLKGGMKAWQEAGLQTVVPKQ